MGGEEGGHVFHALASYNWPRALERTGHSSPNTHEMLAFFVACAHFIAPDMDYEIFPSTQLSRRHKNHDLLGRKI